MKQQFKHYLFVSIVCEWPKVFLGFFFFFAKYCIFWIFRTLLSIRIIIANYVTITWWFYKKISNGDKQIKYIVHLRKTCLYWCRKTVPTIWEILWENSLTWDLWGRKFDTKMRWWRMWLSEILENIVFPP